MKKTNCSNNRHYFKHLTCTLFVVLGLLGIFAPASQAATGAFAFSTATYSVDEGAGKVNITINRVGGSTGAASVSFRTNPITAVAGSDFVNIPLTTLNFAHRESQKVVSVNIINDTVVEPDETFAVLLSNPTYGTTLGNVSSSVVTIRDNDIAPVNSAVDTMAPTVSLTSPATSTTFTTTQTVTIAASASDNVGVSKVELYEGTTLKGTDTTAPYSFAWAISSTNNGNHSFTAKAYDAAGNSKVSSATAVTVNIVSAVAASPVAATSGSFQFAVGAYSVNENGGKVDVIINRVGGSTGTATVGFRTGLVSAKSGTDYVGIPLVTQTFASGVTQKIISIGIIDDKVIEPTETFKVLLSDPTGGATLGTVTESIITILDNDSSTADTTAPTVSLTSPASATTFTSAQTVTITASASDNVGVSKVELYDGANLKATDTTAPYSFAWAITSAYNGSHSFTAKAYDAAGNVASSVARNITVNIAAPVTAKPGSFEFAVGAYSVSEKDVQAEVIINRVGGSDGQVSVTFRTGQITAVTSGDYVGVNAKTVTFNAGETWKAERVSIVNDSVKENEETFKVILSNPTAGATLGARTESIITVLDDDTATTPSPVISGAVKAFPGAEGFGAITKGGRGGKIVKVTNLNDSGAGSLREAIYYTSGPRIVVFEVAGVINLNSVLVIREPFVTIAGQTAPAPGITLGGYGLRIYTHDVVLQHIFVRPNPTITTGGGDGIAIKDSSPDFPYNIVIDHCSVSWANDENISVFPGYGNQTDQNVTISNSLVGEGHYGVLIGSNATRVSFLRNAVMSTVERQPRLGGGTYAHVVNNLLYNDAGSQFSAVGSTWGADQVSYAGNTFIAGPSSRSGMPGIAASSMQSGSKIYAPTSGNYANIASNSLTSSGLSSFLVSTPPVPMDGISVTPVTDIEYTLMQTVGARPAERKTQYADEVDERFLYEIQTRRGSVKDHAIQPWTKPTATARDIDPLLPANPNGDDNGNGYTNIDEFLYQMALQVEGR